MKILILLKSIKIENTKYKIKTKPPEKKRFKKLVSYLFLSMFLSSALLERYKPTPKGFLLKLNISFFTFCILFFREYVSKFLMNGSTLCFNIVSSLLSSLYMVVSILTKMNKNSDKIKKSKKRIKKTLYIFLNKRKTKNISIATNIAVRNEKSIIRKNEIKEKRIENLVLFLRKTTNDKTRKQENSSTDEKVEKGL